MKTLFVAGDIGGARAVLPVIELLKEKQSSFLIAAHRFLDDIADKDFDRIFFDPETDEAGVIRLLETNNVGVVVFATSVEDILPLRVARIAQKKAIPVICVLDNWMNYKKRLEIDSLPLFIPDIYTMMDDYAYNEAVKDGVPQHILQVTGQPAISLIASHYKTWQKSGKMEDISKTLALDSTKKAIIFISEPAEQDQGGPEAKSYRGYTEKDVLKIVCNNLQNYKNELQLFLIPHPRENKQELEKTWNVYKQELSGGLLQLESGREALFFADGVIGMASILLYEAWLLSKPVISCQPGLRNNTLRFMESREGAYFSDTPQAVPGNIKNWWGEVLAQKNDRTCNPDVVLHQGAAENIVNIIVHYLAKGR